MSIFGSDSDDHCFWSIVEQIEHWQLEKERLRKWKHRAEIWMKRRDT
jgi:hypothetical protein